MAKILFIDDLVKSSTSDQMKNEQVVKMLTGLRYEVVSGKNDIKIIEKFSSGRFDLVIINTNKPAKNINETILFFKKHQRDISIIIFTDTLGHVKNVPDNVVICHANLNDLLFSIEDILDQDKKISVSTTKKVLILPEQEREQLRKKRHTKILEERFAKFVSGL